MKHFENIPYNFRILKVYYTKNNILFVQILKIKDTFLNNLQLDRHIDIFTPDNYFVSKLLND